MQIRKFNRRQRLEKRLTRHHLLPRSRNGSSEPSNILWLNWPHHEAWHRLFGLRTPEEVIAILERIRRFKEPK